MQVAQVASILNSAINPEIYGESAVVNEDLSNIVDVGSAVLSSAAGFDNFVKTLPDVIAKQLFQDKVYKADTLGLLRNDWEYGAILQKVYADELHVSENDTWKLQNGTDYSPNVFYGPSVNAKYWNKKTTFEVDLSITEKQVREAFKGASQVAAFVGMLYTTIDNQFSYDLEALAQRLVNTLIAEVINKASNVTSINLLSEYNTEFGQTLTVAAALHDAGFLRYAGYRMGITIDRMRKASKLFNVDGKLRFTNKEDLNIVALKDFKSSMDFYLQSDVWHNEFTELPGGIKTIPYWQGTGVAYDFASISKIDVVAETGVTVSQAGVLAVMFDNNAAMICNSERYTDTNYNPKARFTNIFNRADCSYFLDLSQNAAVFYIA